jgi:hypothetical protein
MPTDTNKKHSSIGAFSQVIALSLITVAIASNHANAAFLVTETGTLDELVAGDSLSAGAVEFLDWQVSNTSSSGGAVAPELADITVEAGVDDLGRAGVRYLMGAAVGPEQVINLNFTYKVSSDAPIELVEALLDAAAANGTGIVSVAETLFETFPGPPVGTLSVSTLGAPHLFGQSVIAPALEMLVVRKDLVLSGGLNGTASFGSLFQLYQAVPEPGAISLWLVGVVVAWSASRRRGGK